MLPLPIAGEGQVAKVDSDTGFTPLVLLAAFEGDETPELLLTQSVTSMCMPYFCAWVRSRSRK